MLSMQEIQHKLTDRNLQVVADRLNVTRSYLCVIRNGKRLSCSEDLQQRLSNYLTDCQHGASADDQPV